MNFWKWLFGIDTKHKSKPPKELLLSYKSKKHIDTNKKSIIMTDDQQTNFVVSNFKAYLNEKLKTDENFQKQTLEIIRRWLNEPNN